MKDQTKINLPELIHQLGRTDVYLLDQIIKGRYQAGEKILDAGCGYGRNVDLLIRAGFTIEGIDLDSEKIAYCQETYPAQAAHFKVGDLEDLPYESESFDHIISSAVLHFSHSTHHFKKLFAEQIRVLKKGGSFFIRMTSSFGMATKNLQLLAPDVYHLPDGSDRFLISKTLLQEMLFQHQLSLLESVKTVNVNDQRAMAVLVFQKH